MCLPTKDFSGVLVLFQQDSVQAVYTNVRSSQPQSSGVH